MSALPIFEGIGKLTEPARLGMDQISHLNEMARICIGETVDHLALLVGPSCKVVEIFAAPEAVGAETIEHMRGIGLADIQPLR